MRSHQHRSSIFLAAIAVGLCALFAANTSATTLKDIKDRGFINVAVANEIPYGFMDASGEAEGAGSTCCRSWAFPNPAWLR